MASPRRRRLLPMAEMNVVPYIDVMLVLLVIFMITAPLLSQGVKVDLPQASAKPIEATPQESIVVSMDKRGQYHLNVGEGGDQRVDAAALRARVAAMMHKNPAAPVMVRADKSVPYGEVVALMTLLQQAGAPSVGLMTEPPR